MSKLLKEFTWDWTWRVMWICLANSFSKTVEVAISPITFRLLASAKMWETKRKFSYNFLHSTSPQSLFISSISHKFSRPNFHITDLKRVLKPLCKIPFDLSIFHLLNCQILWEGNSYHHTHWNFLSSWYCLVLGNHWSNPKISKETWFCNWRFNCKSKDYQEESIQWIGY